MLRNFYASVNFEDPKLAQRIQPDVEIVALYGITHDKEPGKEAAERLRRAAFDMPVIHARTLDMALEDLGY